MSFLIVCSDEYDILSLKYCGKSVAFQMHFFQIHEKYIQCVESGYVAGHSLAPLLQFKGFRIAIPRHGRLEVMERSTMLINTN